MDPMTEQLGCLSGRSTLAHAIRYALNHWDGLTRFLDDGRLELDTNTVERAMRPMCLGRKNWLFAGSDEGTSCCPSAYVLINQEHFGADYQAPAVAPDAARLRGGHPVKRDLRAEQSMARWHRSGGPAKFRYRSVGGPSYGSMRGQRRPHRVSPRHVPPVPPRGRVESASGGARNKHSFGSSHYLGQ